MKKYNILILLLSWVLPAGAQTPEPVTLRHCLETGLEQNYAIRISKDDERISANNATRANAGALPNVTLDAGYSANLDNIRTKSMDGAIGVQNGNFDQGLNIGANLNWTIFDGFKIQTEYKRLKEYENMGIVNTRITIENFVADLTSEYYNYIQQRIRLRNFRDAATLSKERLRIVQERYSIGSFSRLDLQQARVDFNADSSQYVRQQELVFSSRIRLNELMANPDVDARLPVRDTVIDIRSDLDYEELKFGTLNSNASLLKTMIEQNITQLNLKTVKARNYPYVRLNAGYGYNFNHYDFGANRNRQTHGPNSGISIGMNIFDGNRKREVSNALIVVNTAELQEQQLEQQLRADLASFWQAYQNNLELLNLETENLATAKDNYDIAMYRYKLGDLAGIEMREAQQSLLDAEERLVAAQYNTKMCEISLVQISGGVLSYLE